ncbi:MAG: thiamine pyrophosphate-dependent enzyme, partial [Candidatus Bathyarchaeia archaeon]
IKVICANNFNYGMTGGQVGPTTPLEAFTTTTPYGNIEHPFNLVHLAAAAGATYVARWTTLHVRMLTMSIKKLLQRKGFSFIEVISPCPEIYGRRNRMRTGLEMMEWFKKTAVIANFSDPARAEINLERIVVGEFVDVQKPTYEELLHNKMAQIMKEGEEG